MKMSRFGPCEAQPSGRARPKDKSCAQRFCRIRVYPLAPMRCQGNYDEDRQRIRCESAARTRLRGRLDSGELAPMEPVREDGVEHGTEDALGIRGGGNEGRVGHGDDGASGERAIRLPPDERLPEERGEPIRDRTRRRKLLRSMDPGIRT